MPRSLPCALSVVVALVLALSSPAEADTAVMLVDDGGSLFAVNVDTTAEDALVAVNRVGVRKTAIVPRSGVPDVWFSDHASLTLNPFGLELPSGGFNDTGLAIQAVWLDVPPAGGTTADGVLETLQWIQYCLDSFETVDEVAQSARASRIVGKAPLQVLACEPTGRCAMFERSAEEPVFRVAEELPVPALTGVAYRDGLEALNRTLGYGGAPVEPTGPAAAPRFARAARAVHATRTGATDVSLPSAFRVLDDLSVPRTTRWRTVADLRARTLHVSIAGRDEPWAISLQEQTTDCPTPQLVVDLGGDQTMRPRPFALAEHGGLAVAAAAARPATRALAAGAWKAASTYPERVGCGEVAAPATTP